MEKFLTGVTLVFTVGITFSLSDCVTVGTDALIYCTVVIFVEMVGFVTAFTGVRIVGEALGAGDGIAVGAVADVGFAGMP